MTSEVEAVQKYFSTFRGSWQCADPAPEESISNLLGESGLKFPSSYLEFLRHSNGGSGKIPLEPGMFELWPCEELVQGNKDLLVESDMPGFFAFGSSGGGDLFLFNTEGCPWSIYTSSAIGLGDQGEAEKISENFLEFLKLLGSGEWIIKDE